MKTLHKYVLTQQIPPFLFGIFIIILVLVLDFLNKYLYMLIDKGVPVLVSAELLVLSMGWMIVLAVPMAVLIGTLISFMRLASDNEIIAMRTSGLSLAAIAKPLIIASLLLSFAMIPVHNYVVPETNHRLANLLVAMGRKKPALQLREGIFANEIKGFSILAEKVRGNEIEGVTISRIEEGKPAQTIRAERGTLAFAEDGNTLIMKLYNGEINDVDEKDPKRYLRLKFSEHTIYIPDAGGKLVRVHREYRGEREMGIGALRREIASFKTKLRELDADAGKAVAQAADELPLLAGHGPPESEKPTIPGKIIQLVTSTHDRLQTLENQAVSSRRSIRSYSVEVHKKIAISFACAVFVLLGIPVGARAKDSGTGAGMVVSIGVFAVYYAFLKAGETLADRGFIPPFLSMWAANILLGAAGIWLLWRANRQLPWIPESWKGLWRRYRRTC
jgi:lipopolysaccharide export system permease protein